MCIFFLTIKIMLIIEILKSLVKLKENKNLFIPTT